MASTTDTVRPPHPPTYPLVGVEEVGRCRIGVELDHRMRSLVACQHLRKLSLVLPRHLDQYTILSLEVFLLVLESKI